MSDSERGALIEGLLDHQQDTILRILKAAECCFYGYGFNETSMQKIADVAEVSKGLLHYHFQSKEHLFLELQINLYNRLAEQVLALAEEHDTLVGRGLRVLDELYGIFRRSDDLPIQLEIWQRALGNPKLKAHVIRFKAFIRETMITILNGIVGDRVDQLPIDVEAAADLIWVVLSGLKVLSGFVADEAETRKIFDNFKTIVARTLAPVD